ncbi:MAG: maleylpyruvate isomerase N-terminal domain-containing protein [Streptosporangiaceae bacterium]
MTLRDAAVAGLATAYDQVTEVANGLTDATSLVPSRCAGWAVTDVLCHQLLDARRALVTFASPSFDPPDNDAVSYWRPFSPDSGSPAALGSAGALRHARQVRIVASAHPPGQLAADWQQTAEAAVRAAAACPYQAVATQGHTLRTEDFISTLIVEAVVHFLDMTVALPGAPAADPAGLAIVREVLDALAGARLPDSWDDTTCALKGTGRLPLTAADQAALGPLTANLPLFG